MLGAWDHDLTVGVLILLLESCNNLSALPCTGKLSKGILTNYVYTYNNIRVSLYGYNKTSYQNNSVIPASYFYGYDETMID